MSSESIETIQKTIRESLKLIIYIQIILVFLVPSLWPSTYSLGKFYGSLAVVFFIITQIPGLIRRFGLKGGFRDLYKILFPSRAQQGILMFMFGFTHYTTVFLRPVIQIGQPPAPTIWSLSGMLALMITFVLFLTSNIQSKKLLKKWWGRIHKTVFVLSWAIAIHLLFVFDYQTLLFSGNGNFRVTGSLVMLVAIVVLIILQITSLIYKVSKSKN